MIRTSPAIQAPSLHHDEQGRGSATNGVHWFPCEPIAAHETIQAQRFSRREARRIWSLARACRACFRFGMSAVHVAGVPKCLTFAYGGQFLQHRCRFLYEAIGMHRGMQLPAVCAELRLTIAVKRCIEALLSYHFFLRQAV